MSPPAPLDNYLPDEWLSQYDIVRKSWNNLPFISHNINSGLVVKHDNIKYWAWGVGQKEVVYILTGGVLITGQGEYELL